jgi:hypothetical protein
MDRCTIFLKDERRAVLGTVALTQSRAGVTAKLSLKATKSSKKLMLALEGEMLPLSLFEVPERGGTFRMEGRLGDEVSGLLFYRTSSTSEPAAYGFAGRGGIKAQSMLERADKRLFGTRIIQAQDITEKEHKPQRQEGAKDLKGERKREEGEEKIPLKAPPHQEPSTEEQLKSFQESAAKTREELKEDPYLCEDTTLNDIDLIAEENYYDKEREKEKEEEKMERPTFPPYAHMEREGQFFHDFYGKVKDKLKRLFEENERDEELCNLIPDSQFVKIYYDRDKYYSVGLVRENGEPSYLCYCVPQERASEPPEEFEGLCRWFPRDIENPEGAGYWILFQNLSDGNYIRVL